MATLEEALLIEIPETIDTARLQLRATFALEGILRKSRRDNAGERSDSCMYARVF